MSVPAQLQETQLIGNILHDVDEEQSHQGNGSNMLNGPSQVGGGIEQNASTHLRVSQGSLGRPNSAPPVVQIHDVRIT